MGVHHIQTNGALGLFANQAGGHWMQNNGGSALLTKQVRKGDGSAPYTNQWYTGPVCKPSGWVLDAKRWGLGTIDKTGVKGWVQNNGGWAAVDKTG